MGDQALVDELAAVWASILDLGAELTEPEWRQPSLLPGWTVQDVVAHMASTEAILLGRPEPGHVAPEFPHVRNPIGQFVENGVDAYRSASGPEVLVAFAEIVEARLAELRALDADGFDAPALLPLGDGTVRGILPFRIFDCWVHEQDMRGGLGRPGGWDSPAVDRVFRQLYAGMGKVVAKLAAAPEGAIVVWQIGEARCAIEVRNGRGQPVDAPNAPSTVFVLEPEVFLGLATGRGDRATLIAAVMIEGDAVLGVRVLEHMNVLF